MIYIWPDTSKGAMHTFILLTIEVTANCQCILFHNVSKIMIYFFVILIITWSLFSYTSPQHSQSFWGLCQKRARRELLIPHLKHGTLHLISLTEPDDDDDNDDVKAGYLYQVEVQHRADERWNTELHIWYRWQSLIITWWSYRGWWGWWMRLWTWWGW